MSSSSSSSSGSGHGSCQASGSDAEPPEQAANAPAKVDPDEGVEGTVDGHWTGATIEGARLTWRKGDTKGTTTRVTRIGRTQCTLVTNQFEIEGKLKADGKLYWSDDDVWDRLVPASASAWLFDQKDHPEYRRLEREMVERVQMDAKERIAKANVYIGKPKMLSSMEGGGWGGPKEGNDMDERFMLRGEARNLPESAYQEWAERSSVKRMIEDKYVGYRVPEKDTWSERKPAEEPPDSEADDSDADRGKKKKKKAKNKKAKDKKKKEKKNKKAEKKKKKGKKDKDKKNKKTVKKNKNNADA